MQKSKTTKIRKDFQPLTSMVNLVVRSTASPQTQVYDGGTFEPDRGVTPLVILPEVIAKTTDGSWDYPSANILLAQTSIKWLVNGVDVTTLDDWKALVSIDTTSEGYNRGSISISRNVLPTESFDLQFKGTFTDTRLGVNIEVSSEVINLSTVEKADDAYDLYNLYGVGKENNRDACFDGKQYLFSMPINVCHGTEQITEGFTIKLFRITDDEKEELKVDGLEVVKIGTDEMIIDCRFIDHEVYLIELYVGDERKDGQQFEIKREEEGYNSAPALSMSIQPSDEYHRNALRVETDNSVINNPEYYFNINWFSNTANVTAKQWQTGEKCTINLVEAGVGNTSADDWLQVYAESEHKGKFSVLADENGEALTNENGETLITN
jgi:hypothetical protein